jgi:hypothetical protein
MFTNRSKGEGGWIGIHFKRRSGKEGEGMWRPEENKKIPSNDFFKIPLFLRNRSILLCSMKGGMK